MRDGIMARSMDAKCKSGEDESRKRIFNLQYFFSTHIIDNKTENDDMDE